MHILVLLLQLQTAVPAFAADPPSASELATRAEELKRDPVTLQRHLGI